MLEQQNLVINAIEAALGELEHKQKTQCKCKLAGSNVEKAEIRITFVLQSQKVHLLKDWKLHFL